MKFIFEIHNEKLEVNKILIIDRDGVVIKDTGYPHKIKELKFETNNIKKIINFMRKMILIYVDLRQIKVV